MSEVTTEVKKVTRQSKKPKVKDLVLPEYLRLEKGTMFFDTSGDNCSGVTLYNTGIEFVGRGCYTDEEWNIYKEEGYLPKKDIPSDINDNKSNGHGEYGFIKVDPKSYFKVGDIPNDKLGNILNAYRAGILVDFDPEKEAQKKEDKKKENSAKNFKYDKDGDLVFCGKNNYVYEKLNNSKHDDLLKYIASRQMGDHKNLIDMLDYELSGYNRLNRSRHTVIEAIRAKLATFGPNLSGISVEKDEESDKK